MRALSHSAPPRSVAGDSPVGFGMRWDGMFTDAWANARFGHNDLDVAAVDTIPQSAATAESSLRIARSIQQFHAGHLQLAIAGGTQGRNVAASVRSSRQRHVAVIRCR